MVPFEPGPVATLYTCGITPYDATHMGHATVYTQYDDVALQGHGQEDAGRDHDEGKEASGAVPQDALEQEADHDILPRKASVGLSLAILRVGIQLTAVVIRKTRAVVPKTRAVP